MSQTSGTVVDQYDEVVPSSHNNVDRESTYGQAATVLTEYWNWDELCQLEEEFETEYKKLGWTRGPYAKREARRANREFWVNRGEEGARWLARRVRDEIHVDVQDSVANMLANLGKISAKPILAELERDPTPEQAAVLLKAIGWIDLGDEHELADSLCDKLPDCFEHPDDCVRMAAAVATRALPRGEADRLLNDAIARERDEDVRGVIEDEIIEHRG